MSAARSPRTVSCPSCGGPVAWTSESKYRPFCSERCKLLDLGAWATERYRVAGEQAQGEIGDQSATDQDHG